MGYAENNKLIFFYVNKNIKSLKKCWLKNYKMGETLNMTNMREFLMNYTLPLTTTPSNWIQGGPDKCLPKAHEVTVMANSKTTAILQGKKRFTSSLLPAQKIVTPLQFSLTSLPKA